MKRSPGSRTDAERIIAKALDAFEQGAGRKRMNPQAVESFRRQVMPHVCSALERPDWHENWQRERVYLLAYAEALGRRARAEAADDRRTVIKPGDIGMATAKLRGYLPIAGRWCPV